MLFARIGMPAAALALFFSSTAWAQEAPTAPAKAPDLSAFILTPGPPATPRINGARIFGARPGRPFFYRIPATGDRPMTFAATGLPAGLTLDAKTGRITGTTNARGSHKATLTATNARGRDRKPLDIVIGDTIALTPPLGWNSWNCFAGAVDQDKVRAQAEAMARSGLADHGWTYVNMDDTWQGKRGGPYNALQGNEKFPDMKELCDAVHALGLKIGIYSTPWVTSYAGFAGGSATNPEGAWNKSDGSRGMGAYPFASADARQWADWGMDYLKYDWNPIETPQVAEMANALRDSGRDIVLSLSNSAPFAGAADWARRANAWRTTGDIRDNWRSVSGIGFSQDRWAPFAGPGHWNDPDMLVVGMVGWGPRLHPTNLTPDEQSTHITLWSLLAAPLLIGCDMTQLDPFTLSLLTNDEVLAVNQDALGKQATRVQEDPEAGTEIWARPLADGTTAVGCFNRGRYEIVTPRRPRGGQPATTPPVWRLHDRARDTNAEFASQAEADAALEKTLRPVAIRVDWSVLKRSGSQTVRDLWRQKDLGKSASGYTVTVAPHGAAMLGVGTPRP